MVVGGKTAFALTTVDMIGSAVALLGNGRFYYVCANAALK